MDFSQFVPGPAIAWSQEKMASFNAFYESVIAPANGAFIAYDLPYLKYELLAYLTEMQPVLLHGSNNADIRRFEPRQALDATEIGSQKAVYAASDPLVPIWFAVIDRTRSYGSEPFAISSLQRWRETGAGQRIKVYYFAVSAEALRQQPWTTGTVYILPRHTFMPDAAETQWLSREPVVPLARLRLEPADFPLLDHVYGMDVAKILERLQRSLAGYPYLDDPDIHPIRPARA
jgi:hypothetical protein